MFGLLVTDPMKRTKPSMYQSIYSLDFVVCVLLFLSTEPKSLKKMLLGMVINQ